MRVAHRPGLSRRGFCLCCIGAATFGASASWMSPRQAFAAAQGIVQGIRSAAAAAPIKIHPLRAGVSVLEGSGGNVAVLTGRDGKVLIDAGIAVSRRQMAKALATIGPEPVAHVINTHWHFDHADGNAWLHELGPTIIAHENTRKHLSTLTRVEDWDYNFEPLPVQALPGEVFANERTLRSNGTTIDLQHVSTAHTDSDIVVTLREPDIVHMGDLYWNGTYPFIDYSTGGSINGTIRAVDTVLAGVADRTIIIPGHGHPASNKAELRAFRDMLVDIREAVTRLKQQGRTLDETIAAKPTAAHDAQWGNFVVGPTFFTRLVYAGV